MIRKALTAGLCVARLASAVTLVNTLWCWATNAPHTSSDTTPASLLTDNAAVAQAIRTATTTRLQSRATLSACARLPRFDQSHERKSV